MGPESRARRSAAHWVVLALAVLGAAAVAGAGLALEPDARGVGTHEQLGLAPCTSMDRFGIPCPGCGVTTSVALAAQGRLRAALANQPLGFLLATSAPLALVWAFGAHLAGRDLAADLRRVPLVGAGVALAVLVGAAWIYKWITMS